MRLIELQEGEAVELPCGDLLKGYASWTSAGTGSTNHKFVSFMLISLAHYGLKKALLG